LSVEGIPTPSRTVPGPGFDLGSGEQARGIQDEHQFGADMD